MHKPTAPSRERYVVVFREPREAVASGTLELHADRFVLDGRSGTARRRLSVPFREIVEISIGRLPADRLNGYRTLIIDRGSEAPLLVAPVGFGLLGEIADLLTALAADCSDEDDQVVVVVPLRANCRRRAKALLDSGPPLDPAALGLNGHDVYLGEREAVFVFRGPGVCAKTAAAMRDPALWRAGLSWRSCIAGRPQVVAAARCDGDLVYSWCRN